MKRFVSARWVLVMTMVASLLALAPTRVAVAAESIPELQWSAVKSSRYIWRTVTDPTGVTNACVNDNGTLINLRSFSHTGVTTRDLDPSQNLGGQPNCIVSPAVDKNGDLYGYPGDRQSNLAAFHGNMLKWEYPTQCDVDPVVGANGNIYARAGSGRLVGLTPNIKAGTTQPGKVLDIAVKPTGCYGELVALKNGIAILREGRAYVYTYGGKSVGDTPTGTYIDHANQINASGTVFYNVWTSSGGAATFKLVAYDTSRQQASWTVQASIFGNNAEPLRIHATPDGGAMVLIKRAEVVGGIPTTTKVQSVVKINAAGIKVWEKELPNQDAQGNVFGYARIVVDVNGNIIATREGSLKTNNPYNGSVPAISISALDRNGSIFYNQLMRGNIDRAVGPVSGYTVDGQGVNGPIPGLNTLYLLGTCREGCQSFLETKLYPIKIPGLGLDYPRGAVLTANMPQQPAAVSYVGLGDSYSSSWGAGLYAEGTATDKNTCRRSARAYAHVLHNNPYSPLRLDGFAACGGATAPRITSPWPNTGDKLNLDERPQVDAVPSTTRVVTLTMGGNDVGFADVIKGCVTTCTQAVATATNKVNTTLAPALTRAYQAILAKAPKADVYVLGYPPMLSTSSPLCKSSAPFNTTSKRTLGIDLLKKLNAKIKATVAAQGSSRLHYLDPMATGSPFIGHDICSANPYVYGVNALPANPSGVFHPKPVGQIAYAKLVTSYLAAHPLR